MQTPVARMAQLTSLTASIGFRASVENWRGTESEASEEERRRFNHSELRLAAKDLVIGQTPYDFPHRQRLFEIANEVMNLVPVYNQEDDEHDDNRRKRMMADIHGAADRWENNRNRHILGFCAMPNADPTSSGCLAVLRLAGDLEECLKAITPDKREHRGLKVLIDRHPEKFSNLSELRQAKNIRNCITHRDPLTDAQTLRAEVAFDQALRDILPHCPPALQMTITRRLEVEHGSGASERSQAPHLHSDDEPNPEPSPPPPPPPIGPPSVVASSLPAIPPPTLPAPHPKRETFWFILAAAFLIVGAFAYIVRPKVDLRRETAGVQAAPEPSPRPVLARPGPTEPPSAKPVFLTREEQLTKLINSNLSISAAQPNIAVVIVASGPGNSGSAVNALQRSLSDPNLHLIFNLADINKLMTAGFFDDMYSGDGQLAYRAVQLSRVDYIL